ncbi:histone-lysine N-methyltransferase SETMAR [Trichonephila clavipes]|nr:histone-lysine N-methyltransferase SETMAR [Trichonephila clavipes]
MITRGRMSLRWPGIRYSDLVGRLKAILLTHLAPLDYHLFHSLNNYLSGKSFTNEADVRKALTDFFASHTPEFYLEGIEQLETRWKKVLDADGNYFED